MYPRGPNSQQRPLANQNQPYPVRKVPDQGPNGPSNASQSKIDPARQREKVADKLISDCYSKVIIDKNGKRYTDTSYQTHIDIKEFSSYQSHPPPDNIPPGQIGSIKNRVLVICVKYSGRVIIQKGKYNETKNVYQIGRTWDMDELKAIKKVGNDGIILTLNKDYYWKVEEGLERVWKFARFLTKAYGGFMGRYPILNGFTLEEFKLPPIPMKKSLGNGQQSDRTSGSTNDIVLNEPTPDSQLLKSRSLKRKNMPNPVLPSESSLQNNQRTTTQLQMQPSSTSAKSNEFYKDFDFTSNGKLPMKSMKVMEVDRPVVGSANTVILSQKTSEQFSNTSSEGYKYNKTDNERTKQKGFIDNHVKLDDNDDFKDISKTPRTSTHPYQQKSPLKGGDLVSNDSQSFIFKARDTYSSEKLHEYVKENEVLETSPLRKYNTQKITAETEQRKVSDPLESVAVLGLRLEEKLGGYNAADDFFQSDHSLKQPAISKNPGYSPDFGIEEITDVSEDSLTFPSATGATDKGLAISQRENSPEIIEESTKLEANDISSDNINSSIQEIENFIGSQLHFGVDDKGNKTPNQTVTANVIQNEVLNSNQAEESNLGTSLEINESTNKNANEQSDISNIREGYPLEEDESLFTQGYVSKPDLNIQKKEETQHVNFEKDPELEELLEEVNWTISDNSDSLIKKLTKELNNVKQHNIKEIVSLDFSKDSVSNDITTSLNEIENLNHIFKKMEIDFKFLAPEVRLIETNSHGLQVKSVNKKVLYNDLKSILSKVSMSSADLTAIESFKEFDRLNKIEALESKLVGLYNALGTIRYDSNEDKDDLGSMRALRQYQTNYEKVTSKFIRHFNSFIKEQFKSLIDQFSSDLERFYPNAIFRELNNLLIYSSITYFIKNTSPNEFSDLNNFFNQLISEFLEKLIRSKLKNVKGSGASSVSSNLSQTFEINPLKKSRTLRLSTRKDKFIGKLGLNDDDHKTQQLDNSKKSTKNPNEIEDPKTVISIIDDSKDLICLLQYFVGYLFHFGTNILDFNEYINTTSYKERRKLLETSSIDKIDVKRYSNELIANMNFIFGSYINIFMKKVTPSELSIPVLLIYLETLLHENQRINQEFLVFNFLKKAIEKFKGIWNKFIRNQIELLNKSTIVVKCGILPAVKNVIQLLLVTESSLERSTHINETSVRSMVDKSYKEITEAAIHLFMRDDPLLKSHDFDDKEREYRNVSIIKNVFYFLEQFPTSDIESINKMKFQLESVLKKVQENYFQKLLIKNVGKLVEFVNNYEALSKMNNGKPKKYNKKYLKSLLTGYTSKDVSMKAHEIFKKLEKHYITGSDMFEKDLLDKLWLDMENEFVGYFSRLDNIIRANFDKDIEHNISKQEIHSIFKSIY